MARTPQVTRTIQTTKVNVLCLNIKEGQPFHHSVVLPRTYKDDKHMLKAVEKVVNSDTVKAVHVVDSVVEETLYGMSEQKFIELATVLPPRKPTDKDGEGDNATEDNGDTDEDDIEPQEGENVTSVDTETVETDSNENEIATTSEAETSANEAWNIIHNGDNRHHSNKRNRHNR